MNLGKTILALRKKKNVTQEELAAELGVTAAAVSKWEHDYTLPDVLMLCALADYFDVTTDELLGRCSNRKHAVILAANSQLGEKMAELIGKFDFEAHGIFTDEAAALAAAEEDPRVGYMIVGVYENGYTDDSPLQKIVSCHATDSGVLMGLEWALKNCLDDNSRINVLN